MRPTWSALVLLVALIRLQLVQVAWVDARFAAIDSKLDRIEGLLDRIGAGLAAIGQRLEQQGPGR